MALSHVKFLWSRSCDLRRSQQVVLQRRQPQVLRGETGMKRGSPWIRLHQAEAEVKSIKSSRDYYMNRTLELEDELKNLHFLMDVVPNGPPRGTELEDYSVFKRLILWIISKK